MSECRSAAPAQNELCFETSICDEGYITGAVNSPLSQIPEAQNIELLCLFRSELVLTMLQNFTQTFSERFAEMQEDAQTTKAPSFP